MERGPGRGRPVRGRRGEELGGERPRQARREAGGPEQRGEARGRAGGPRPVPRVRLQPAQDLQQHVVRQSGQRRRHLGERRLGARAPAPAPDPALLRLLSVHGWRSALGGVDLRTGASAEVGDRWIVYSVLWRSELGIDVGGFCGGDVI